MSGVADQLAAPLRQLATLRERGHRPFPLPRRPWLLGQTWDVLLFAHWPLPPDTLRPHVPPQLELDTLDGSAWLGITPFRLTGLQLVATPAVPRVSTFPELNVRTYVTLERKPGIWFFSLDAASEGAVAVARRFYRLPYVPATMRVRRAGEDVCFESERAGGDAAFRATYRPTGPVSPARPGTLEHFLAERYCLYTVDEKTVYRSVIHHPPWPLQPATAEIALNTMPPPGVELRGDPLLHFSARQDVLIWPLERVRTAG